MNKTKTNKWVEIMKSSVSDTVKFTNLFYRVKSVQDLKDLLTQTQQETLEWCEKQIGECYKQGITTVQFKDGTSLLFTCQESLYDVNSFIKHLKQTIKQRKEEVKE